jgi:hypothetical protein
MPARDQGDVSVPEPSRTRSNRCQTNRTRRRRTNRHDRGCESVGGLRPCAPVRSGPAESADSSGNDFGRLAMIAERRREEVPRSLGIASGRDVHVDDLPVLVDGSRNATVRRPSRRSRPHNNGPQPRAGTVRPQQRAAPGSAAPTGIPPRDRPRSHARRVVPRHRDRQAEPEVPAHRQDDDLRREAEAGERRTREHG